MRELRLKGKVLDVDMVRIPTEPPESGDWLRAGSVMQVVTEDATYHQLGKIGEQFPDQYIDIHTGEVVRILMSVPGES